MKFCSSVRRSSNTGVGSVRVNLLVASHPFYLCLQPSLAEPLSPASAFTPIVSLPCPRSFHIHTPLVFVLLLATTFVQLNSAVISPPLFHFCLSRNSRWRRSALCFHCMSFHQVPTVCTCTLPVVIPYSYSISISAWKSQHLC